MTKNELINQTRRSQKRLFARKNKPAAHKATLQYYKEWRRLPGNKEKQRGYEAKLFGEFPLAYKINRAIANVASGKVINSELVEHYTDLTCKQLRAWGKRNGYRPGSGKTIDHIVPVIAFLRKLYPNSERAAVRKMNVMSNLQVITKHQNQVKGSKCFTPRNA